MGELLTYADIAERMGVTIGSVRQRAHDDDAFPKRANAPRERSPRFRPEEVAAYIQARNERRAGAAGRPTSASRSAAGTPVTNAAEVGSRIRALMDAPDAPITDVRTLAKLLELEPHAVRYRLRGQTKWREHELATIARVYRVSIDDLAADELPIPLADQGRS